MQTIYIVHVNNDCECDEYTYYFSNFRAATECFSQILHEAGEWEKNPEDDDGHTLTECMEIGNCKLPGFYAELGTEHLLDKWN